MDNKLNLGPSTTFTEQPKHKVPLKLLIFLKITAHKTFKNKFDQIRAGIKFIYRQNTSVISNSVFRQTNMQHLTAN